MTTHYEVEGRNGYYAVDEYDGTRCIRTVATHLSKAAATCIADALNEGYARGQADATTTAAQQGGGGRFAPELLERLLEEWLDRLADSSLYEAWSERLYDVATGMVPDGIEADSEEADRAIEEIASELEDAVALLDARRMLEVSK